MDDPNIDLFMATLDVHQKLLKGKDVIQREHNDAKILLERFSDEMKRVHDDATVKAWNLVRCIVNYWERQKAQLEKSIAFVRFILDSLRMDTRVKEDLDKLSDVDISFLDDGDQDENEPIIADNNNTADAVEDLTISRQPSSSNRQVTNNSGPTISPAIKFNLPPRSSPPNYPSFDSREERSAYSKASSAPTWQDWYEQVLIYVQRGVSDRCQAQSIDTHRCPDSGPRRSARIGDLDTKNKSKNVLTDTTHTRLIQLIEPLPPDRLTFCYIFAQIRNHIHRNPGIKAYEITKWRDWWEPEYIHYKTAPYFQLYYIFLSRIVKKRAWAFALYKWTERKEHEVILGCQSVLTYMEILVLESKTELDSRQPREN
ncbi:uncharacterized protein IL334_000848 [Kwoniella shivajii]|uniref:Uncharacterized protein n=1 Tax=Kwoniella shivajii TaxID=564305 RepID=A0ABZ1CTD3_9TREE|nr:hypothetical protein IL334_000848 [Kwoniella shivajii]